MKDEIPYDEACNLEPWRAPSIEDSGRDDGPGFVWYVTWGEELQMPDRRKTSRWQSLKYRAQGWRWWWSDLVLEAAYRIRKAWRALRHG